MPNLLLTTDCVRNCPYCFAKKEMNRAVSDRYISWDNVIYVADMLIHSNETHISLLGGEPTLHPYFIDIVLYLIQRGLHVIVFTSGVMSEDKLLGINDHLSELQPDLLGFVCNVNDPARTPVIQNEIYQITRFFSSVGPLTTAGFNIYQEDFDLNFIFNYINSFGLKRELRIGIASPIVGHSNVFLPPDSIKKCVNRIFEFKTYLEQFNIRLLLDCGFPLCAFSDDQIGWLRKTSPDNHYTCKPAIDITPDLDVYNCLPLANYHRRSLFEFNCIEEISDYYCQHHAIIRQEIAGIYKECDGCKYAISGVCSGGGVCQVLRLFEGEEPVRLPEVESGLSSSNLSL
jgi:sulfatase maturation enzyme AslB (radical SAM superfamily)